MGNRRGRSNMKLTTSSKPVKLKEACVIAYDLILYPHIIPRRYIKRSLKQQLKQLNLSRCSDTPSACNKNTQKSRPARGKSLQDTPIKGKKRKRNIPEQRVSNKYMESTKEDHDEIIKSSFMSKRQKIISGSIDEDFNETNYGTSKEIKQHLEKTVDTTGLLYTRKLRSSKPDTNPYILNSLTLDVTNGNVCFIPYV